MQDLPILYMSSLKDCQQIYQEKLILEQYLLFYKRQRMSRIKFLAYFYLMEIY